MNISAQIFCEEEYQSVLNSQTVKTSRGPTVGKDFYEPSWLAGN